MALLPATGSEMTMGQVYKAFTNTTATAGSNVSLSATLGPYKGVSAGNQISMSSTFGGATTPYAY